jgi:hypothetical protein
MRGTMYLVRNRPISGFRRGGGEPGAVLAYYGHHKCASTWITYIVAMIARELGLQKCTIVDPVTPWSTGPLTDFTATFERQDLRTRVGATRSDLVLCLAADRLQAEVLRPARAFHVIRDPRDIVVSAYFSHRKTHPTDGLPHLQAHREELQRTTLHEGLLLEMAFSRCELGQIGEWNYGDPSVLELRTEELTLHPYDGFISIFRHLGLLDEAGPNLATEHIRRWVQRLLNRLSWRPGLGFLRQRIDADAETVLGVVYRQRFDAQTAGRARGTEDVSSHYRKGVSGDWKNYFTREHAESFEEQFGDLLRQLGYEESAGWVDEARAVA